MTIFLSHDLTVEHCFFLILHIESTVLWRDSNGVGEGAAISSTFCIYLCAIKFYLRFLESIFYYYPFSLVIFVSFLLLLLFIYHSSLTCSKFDHL